MNARIVGLMVAALGLACEPPPVVATADERQHQEAGRIEGQVLVTGLARGDVVLSLFDASRPPPPEGTGRPISFAIVPGEKVFGAGAGDESNTGPFMAPYAFDLVPEGRYLIKGFVDRNGCMTSLGCREPDFIPWYGVTGEPNAGDVGGAAVDPISKQVRVIEVARGEDGVLKAATGVTVSFAESATVPVDRPAFDVLGEQVLDLAKPVSLLKLVSKPIKSDLVHQEAATFLLRYVDGDGDGVPDDANKDGIPEFWPKVFVKRLADADVPLKDDAAPIVLAAGFRPDVVLPMLMNGDGTPRMTPVPVTSLDLAIRPMALDATDPLAPKPLASVPPGRYAVIVIQFTGQTWRVPNELQPAVAEAAGLPAFESQGFYVEVAGAQ